MTMSDILTHSSISFTDEVDTFRQRPNLEANIVLTKNKEVLVIPRNALLKGDSVMVKMDGETKRVKINTGIADDEWVEVKEGLGKDATIIIE